MTCSTAAPPPLSVTMAPANDGGGPGAGAGPGPGAGGLPGTTGLSGSTVRSSGPTLTGTTAVVPWLETSVAVPDKGRVVLLATTSWPSATPVGRPNAPAQNHDDDRAVVGA